MVLEVISIALAFSVAAFLVCVAAVLPDQIKKLSSLPSGSSGELKNLKPKTKSPNKDRQWGSKAPWN